MNPNTSGKSTPRISRTSQVRAPVPRLTMVFVTRYCRTCESTVFNTDAIQSACWVGYTSRTLRDNSPLDARMNSIKRSTRKVVVMKLMNDPSPVVRADVTEEISIASLHLKSVTSILNCSAHPMSVDSASVTITDIFASYFGNSLTNVSMLANTTHPSRNRNNENRISTPNSAAKVGIFLFLSPTIMGLKIIESSVAMTNGINTVFSCKSIAPSTKTAIVPTEMLIKVFPFTSRTIIEK